MAAAPFLFALAMGLWWGRVALSLGLSWGLGGALSAALAFGALWVAGRLGYAFVDRAEGVQRRAGRGFLALGLSFGLGALPLAATMMRAGESAGAEAAGGANPLGPVFGTVLAPILAGNLVAGLMVALAAGAAVICLALAALFSLGGPARGGTEK